MHIHRVRGRRRTRRLRVTAQPMPSDLLIIAARVTYMDHNHPSFIIHHDFGLLIPCPVVQRNPNYRWFVDFCYIFRWYFLRSDPVCVYLIYGLINNSQNNFCNLLKANTTDCFETDKREYSWLVSYFTISFPEQVWIVLQSRLDWERCLFWLVI